EGRLLPTSHRITGVNATPDGHRRAAVEYRANPARGSSTQVGRHLCAPDSRPVGPRCARSRPASALPPAPQPDALPPAPDQPATPLLPAVRAPDVPVHATAAASRQSAPRSPTAGPTPHRSGGGAAPDCTPFSSIDDS